MSRSPRRKAIKRRRYERRQRLERVKAIIRAGGDILAHPDTVRSILRQMPQRTSAEQAMYGVRIISHGFIPRGTIVAALLRPPEPPPPTIQFGSRKFTFDELGIRDFTYETKITP